MKAAAGTTFSSQKLTSKGGFSEEEAAFEHGGNMQAHLTALEKQMREAAANLEFEEAARLRDEIKRLEELDLETR